MDYKVGEWIVFLNGPNKRAMQIKVITNDKKRFRTYKPINNMFWHELKSVRKASISEINESKKYIRA